MNRTKIEWTRDASGAPGYTWNPIKGLCPEGCWYCYARGIYRRFKLDPEPWLDIAELNMALHTKRTGKRVFVCSTFEIFNPITETVWEHHDGKPWTWRDFIFDVIGRRPDLTFIILTKRPERIDRPMPPNVWLGVSVTGGNQTSIDRIAALYGAKAKVKFVSLEPFIDHAAPHTLFRFMVEQQLLQWVIVGRLTGHGHKHDPAPQLLGRLHGHIKLNGIPLFVKNNLHGIWPGPLIQEFPQ